MALEVTIEVTLASSMEIHCQLVEEGADTIDRLSRDMELLRGLATTSLVRGTTTERVSMGTTRLLTSRLILNLVVERPREDKVKDKVEGSREDSREESHEEEA